MPHQRKYVPSHLGGTASQPSRAKRWMSAYASQGFSSRLSLSTRCAFVSFTASLMGASRNHGCLQKRKSRGAGALLGRPPGLCLCLRRRLTTESCHPTYRRSTRTHALHRGHLAVTRPVGGLTFRIALLMTTSFWSFTATCALQTGQRKA